MTNEEIENRFTYHSPSKEQIPVYEGIRERAKEFAILLNEILPESREKSLAFTKLESVVFWANASIARNPV